jgi:hypothetical protein
LARPVLFWFHSLQDSDITIKRFRPKRF